MDCSLSGSTVHIKYWILTWLQLRILDWVAMPSSRGSCQPRDQTQVSWIAGGFFIVWANNEARYFCFIALLFFSCAAYGILVFQPEMEPAPPAVEVQSLNHCTTREVPYSPFFEAASSPFSAYFPLFPLSMNPIWPALEGLWQVSFPSRASTVAVGRRK